MRSNKPRTSSGTLEPFQQLAAGPSAPGNLNRSSSGSKGSGRVDIRRSGSLPSRTAPQAPTAARQKDKFVPLSSAGSAGEGKQGRSDHVRSYTTGAIDIGPSPAIFEDIDESTITGRITVMTVAESFERQQIEKLLQEKYPWLQMRPHQEVVHATPKMDDPTSGDIFIFDYGTVVFWGINAAEEQGIVHAVINPCKVEPLELSDVEIDEFEFNYSLLEPPHIQNDVITINKGYAADHQVKLAISHALAQSTKLGIYEERIQLMVEDTRHLPETLAENGSVHIGRHEIAQLMGQVFLQRAAVNLLSTVMDIPEFFWSAPDHLQVLYKRVCEYLELTTRVEVLNNRFGVLQEMLDMLRDEQNRHHQSRLEWIVIWLIVLAVLVGICQVGSILSPYFFKD